MVDLDYNAEISWLMTEAQGEMGDAHEIHMRLQLIIASLRAEGLPVPKDLKDLEARLDKEFETVSKETNN